jgi:hypothetical protein
MKYYGSPGNVSLSASSKFKDVMIFQSVSVGRMEFSTVFIKGMGDVEGGGKWITLYEPGDYVLVYRDSDGTVLHKKAFVMESENYIDLDTDCPEDVKDKVVRIDIEFVGPRE